MTGFKIRLGGIVVCVATLLGACASAPAPVAKSTTIEVSAKVSAVDKQLRQVDLRTANGRELTLALTSDVRNFDQIKVGDEVIATYYEAIGLAVAADKGAKAFEQSEARVRAAAGARPGTAAGKVSTATVVIESVDTSFNTVTFKRDDGKSRTVAVNDPDGQAFARKLKRGDSVQIAYVEAAAVSVVPAR